MCLVYDHELAVPNQHACGALETSENHASEFLEHGAPNQRACGALETSDFQRLRNGQGPQPRNTNENDMKNMTRSMTKI